MSLVQKLPGGYLLHCFLESICYCGVAFVVSPKLEPHLRRFWSVSDRVGIAESHLPKSKGTKPSKLFIIAAYEPHTRLCLVNPQTCDNFYDSLQRAWFQTKEGKYLTFIVGDKVEVRRKIQRLYKNI